MISKTVELFPGSPISAGDLLIVQLSGKRKTPSGWTMLGNESWHRWADGTETWHEITALFNEAKETL